MQLPQLSAWPAPSPPLPRPPAPPPPRPRRASPRRSLRSRATAVKVGDESAGSLRYLTFEGLDIADCTRGLAIQLRDGGSVEHVAFRGVTLATRLSHPAWGGAAEPIHVTAVPRGPGSKLGAVTDVSFRDVRATAAENGVFIAGGPMGGGSAAAAQRRPYRISGLTLQRVGLALAKRTAYRGGCQDYRPSSNATAPAAAGEQWWPSGGCGSGGGRGGERVLHTAARRGPERGAPCARRCEPRLPRPPPPALPAAGLDCSWGGTVPIWVAGAERVTLDGVSVERQGPWRADWRRAAHIDPYSTRAVVLKDVTVTSPPGQAGAASAGAGAEE